MITPPLDRIARDLIRVSRRGIADIRRADSRLTMAEQSILTYIADHPGARSIDIAAEFNLNRSTVSRQLSHLIELGLVRGRGDAGGRGMPLELTPQGEADFEEAIGYLTARIAARLEGWTDDEVAAFAAELARFTRG